jgi:cytidyltransferase-like protein
MSVVTIGTFDGVHAGHRALIAYAPRLADERGETRLCVGSEFRLGRAGEGDVSARRALGVEVHAVDLLHHPWIRSKISSSTARRAIAAGVPASLAVEGWAPLLGNEGGGGL